MDVNLEIALLYSLMSSGALFFAAIFSQFVKIKGSTRSFAQHFAAGVVFAAVARELLPKVMGVPIDLAVGFSIGVIAMLLVGKLSGRFGMLTAMGIDLWIDGVLIGIAFLAGTQTGILVAISLAFCALFLGLSISSSLKKGRRILGPFLLALLLPLGVICATFFLGVLPKEYYFGSLAFGMAALLYLVTEELLKEAHEIKETPWITASFFIGFLFVLLIK